MSESGIPKLLTGKKAVVMGIQNDFSIAYHIAEAFGEAGAQLALSVVDDRPLRYTKKLEERFPGSFTFTCNVDNEAELDAMQATLKSQMGTVDALVHS
ncbi:MAG: SDR family oxidoreductase, partial [Chloroflexota bacterium]